PETLRGLWKQRLRWATGGAQVLRKNLGVMFHPTQNHLWPMMIEASLSVVWSYTLVTMLVLWIAGYIAPHGWMPIVGSPLIPSWSSALLGGTCLAQFGISMWFDSHYDRGLGRNFYWMVWYPLVFWIITTAATVVGYPKAFALGTGTRARWTSPDRGAHLRMPKPPGAPPAESNGSGRDV
ncbi:MAG TPA: hypothetical protein VMT50_12350, partial [Steroidobacteraceae bacterium]|nr:hypothetical protein [Steroidobacteraceae bacterium]